MTLPNERTRAVISARAFLIELTNPKATPRVPKEIRTRAYWVLRHFPWDLHLEESALKLPGVWGAAGKPQEQINPDNVLLRASETASEDIHKDIHKCPETTGRDDEA